MAISLIDRFAQYAVGLTYERFAPEVTGAAKRVLFDTLATGLGGYQTALGRKTACFVAEEMPGNQATLLGSGADTTVEGAAFGNATMIKILGMDDSHRTASHIAAQVVPAALAVGQWRKGSGRDLVVALVAAYDLAVRLGRAVRAPQRARGLDVKGTVGTLAATVAAGCMAGLDADGLAYALGLAADMASGSEQYVYDRGLHDTKDLISGFAARNGVFAVRLAGHGFHGPRTGLDGEYGFLRAFGDGLGADIFDDLGEARGHAIVTTGFKPHGGCRHTHQAVDCVQQILGQGPLHSADIERVTIATYRYATEPLFRVTPDPGTRELAGMSIRVATAIALVRGTAWPDDYDHWDDPEVRRLRHVTDVQVDPEIEAHYPARNGCRVRVELRGGSLREGRVEYARGEPENPMSNDELKAKCLALTRKVLTPSRVERLHELCMGIAEVDDLGSLLKSITIK